MFLWVSVPIKMTTVIWGDTQGLRAQGSLQGSLIVDPPALWEPSIYYRGTTDVAGGSVTVSVRQMSSN